MEALIEQFFSLKTLVQVHGGGSTTAFSVIATTDVRALVNGDFRSWVRESVSTIALGAEFDGEVSVALAELYAFSNRHGVVKVLILIQDPGTDRISIAAKVDIPIDIDGVRREQSRVVICNHVDQVGTTADFCGVASAWHVA
jgi:hypothetical protein